jgi:membrane protein required for colicin V production
MNVIDIILLSILFVFFLFGVKRGFFLSLMQLIGIGVIILLIQQFGSLMRTGIHEKLGIPETLAVIIGYILIFVLIMLVAKIITVIIQKFMKTISLGWIDRVLGGVLGIVFGIIFVVLAVLIIEVSSAGESIGEARENSPTYSMARVLASSVLASVVYRMPGYHPESERPRRSHSGHPI